MGVGPVCRTSLSTGLSEWELGPRHAERSPIEREKEGVGEGILSQGLGKHRYLRELSAGRVYRNPHHLTSPPLPLLQLAT